MVVDTGPLIAALDARDRLHDLAVRHLTRARRRALVPDPVVVEVDILARRWLGPGVARVFLSAMSSGVHDRVTLDTALWRRAVDLDAMHADLDLGLVDTSVMAVAEERGLPVFTFDFRAFRAVPGPFRGGSWKLVVEEKDLL